MIMQVKHCQFLLQSATLLELSFVQNHTFLQFNDTLNSNRVTEITRNDYHIQKTLPSTIINLNQMLRPFKDAHCLLHITSFKDVSIHPDHSFPRILRKLAPTLLSLFYKFNIAKPTLSVYSGFLWSLSKFDKFDQFQISKQTLTCPHPSNFLGSKLHEDQLVGCALLHYKSMSLKMKSWNCQVELIIFPPIFTQKIVFKDKDMDYSSIISLPGIWNFEFFERLTKTFPSKMPMFTIMVMNSNQLETLKQMNGFTDISGFINPNLFAAFTRSIGQLSNQVGLIYEVGQSEDTNSSSFVIGDRNGNAIVNYIHLLLLNIGRYFLVNSAARISRSTWIKKFAALGNIIKMTSNEYLDWEISSIDGALIKIEEHFLNCVASSGISPLEILQLPTIEHREMCSNVHLWNSLTRKCIDASSCIPRNNSVYLQLQLEQTPPDKILTFVPIKYRSSISRMNFVSCGQTTTDNLQFGELINIFDVYTWTFALLSGILISALDYCSFRVAIGKSLNLTFKDEKVVLSLVRIFLEQGNAILKVNSKIRKQSRRILLAGVLLAGIVLSNAYKNTNVYNMITPLANIPADTFDTLIKYDFTIFTRLYLISELPLVTYNWYLSIQGANIFQDQHHIKVRNPVDQNVETLVSSEIFIIRNKWLVHHSEEDHSSEIKLFNHSRLLPGSDDRLHQVLQHNNTKMAMRMNKVTFTSELPYLKRLQNMKISQMLESCKKVAIVFSQSMYIEFIKMLPKMRITGHWYIGKESWFASDIGISVSGTVTKNILARIDYLRESGIWDWWEMLPSKMDRNILNAKVSSSTFFRRPTMDGNVVIIFTVWLIGLGVALAKFICELGKLRKFYECQIKFTVWFAGLSAMVVNLLCKVRKSYYATIH